MTWGEGRVYQDEFEDMWERLLEMGYTFLLGVAQKWETL